MPAWLRCTGGGAPKFVNPMGGPDSPF